MAIEAVGLPATFAICQAIVAAGGHIANVGVHGKPVELHLEKLWDRNISLTTRLVDTVTTPMLLKVVRSGKLQPKKLVTHRFAMKLFLVASLFLVVPFATGQAGQQATDKSAPPATVPVASAASPEVSKYVGAETCKTCHEEIYNSWEKTPHWKTTLDTKGGPSHQGCEGCHGPGADHVAGGGDKSKIFVFENASTKDINARCMNCHEGGTQHMNAVNSIHTQNNVSCISCHSPHHAQTKEFLLVKAQPELCYSCHLQQKSQFQMPFHHRVNEGLVQCSDCHNPHGTVGPKQVRTSATQDAVCFTCHADKQGPFVFEHEPVKIEGLLILPYPAWRRESSHAEGEQRQFALPAMPYQCYCHRESRRGARNSFVP